MKNWMGALLIGLVLTLFAAPAAMAFTESKPAATAQDGDGKGKKGKKHGKKHGKKQGKKKSQGKGKHSKHRKHHKK